MSNDYDKQGTERLNQSNVDEQKWRAPVLTEAAQRQSYSAGSTDTSLLPLEQAIAADAAERAAATFEDVLRVRWDRHTREGRAHRIEGDKLERLSALVRDTPHAKEIYVLARELGIHF